MGTQVAVKQALPVRADAQSIRPTAYHDLGLADTAAAELVSEANNGNTVMNQTKVRSKPINPTLLNDVLFGLSQRRKSLPSKYLYDQRGSELFDAICELDEYYLTRAELQIMQSNRKEIAEQVGSDVMLVEYGSGSSVKTRILLDSLDTPAAYVPVDISREHVLRTAKQLQMAYSQTEVIPLVADFTKPFELPSSKRRPSHVALYFPGSTIGNFTQREAGNLLQTMSQMLGNQGGLLIGIDLQKELSVVQTAYDDSQGITAEFSLNLLRRLNRELHADFDLSQFQHEAIYNPKEHCIEISLVSRSDQIVIINDHVIAFENQEKILTEYSHKYTIDGFADFAAQFGFSLHCSWTDESNQFGVLQLVLA